MAWKTALIISLAAAPASVEEMRLADDAFTKCLFDQTAKFDDGHSDPLSVARVIMPICNSELIAVAEVKMRGQPRADRKAAYFVQFMREEPTMAASVVLAYRKARSQEK